MSSPEPEEVGGVESTLDSTHRPTDLPTDWYDNPTNYVSIRITIPHAKWPKIKRTVLFDSIYIAYPHRADTGTQKEHWHIAVPSDERAKTITDRYRKRIKDSLGLSGNEQLRVVHEKNGVHSFCQYCTKEEDSVPKVSPELVKCVANAPKWEQKTISAPSTAADPKKDRDWQLTYSNLVVQCVNYHRRAGLSPNATLKETFLHMIDHTKWRPSYHLVSHGVPNFFQTDFERRIGRKTKLDMEWWNWRG